MWNTKFHCQHRQQKKVNPYFKLNIHTPGFVFWYDPRLVYTINYPFVEAVAAYIRAANTWIEGILYVLRTGMCYVSCLSDERVHENGKHSNLLLRSIVVVILSWSDVKQIGNSDVIKQTWLSVGEFCSKDIGWNGCGYVKETFLFLNVIYKVILRT